MSVSKPKRASFRIDDILEIKTNSAVKSIKRIPNQVEVITENQSKAYFDHVFIACHSNQALAMLENPLTIEQQLLSRISYFLTNSKRLF